MVTHQNKSGNKPFKRVNRQSGRKRSPLKMLDYAKKVVRVNVVRDHDLEKLRQISDLLKSYYDSLAIDPVFANVYRVKSFVPIKGWRIDRNGDKKYFYYLIYHVGPKKYRRRPSVALLAVGNENFVSSKINEHLEDLRNGVVSYAGLPCNFWRSFETETIKTESV